VPVARGGVAVLRGWRSWLLSYPGRASPGRPATPHADVESRADRRDVARLHLLCELRAVPAREPQVRLRPAHARRPARAARAPEPGRRAVTGVQLVSSGLYFSSSALIASAC